MILHITFHSKANPYCHYSNRETLQRDWERWARNPDAIPEFLVCSSRAQVLRNIAPNGETWWILRNGTNISYYKRLGNALRALDRIGDIAREEARKA